MGWKSIKEHYRISHYVAVYPDKGICIGSSYVHNLIVVGFNGEVQPNRIVRRGEGGELGRYIEEMEADPSTLRKLIEQPDTFDRSITVYTYEGGEIIDCECEELGWPNVTHDGRMMYENTFSPDRAEVVRWATESARAAVDVWKRRVSEALRELVEVQAHLTRVERDLAQLEPRP